MSLERHADTIVAPITAPGGAVGVVRLSGPMAFKIAQGLFEPWPGEPVSHRAVYGRFAHGDDGLALPFEEGRSYTGEQSVEMSVHGSQASVGALVTACIAAGARAAEPGEFTLRAFMNGRLDLTQAEGVRDSVTARTDAQLRQANLLREGALRDQVRALRDEAVGILAMVEAATDFSEETGELDRGAAVRLCLSVGSRIDQLLATEHASRVLREGASVAIVGLPNAGKSSLLNALLSADRAIVTDVPGTTRDTVEESLSLGGLLVTLIDTAGLRETSDPVESLGVERSRAATENADLVIYLYDAAVGWQPEDQARFCSLSRPGLVAANKCDLAPRPELGLPVSTKTREGLARLIDSVQGLLASECDRPGLINSRHARSLREAKGALRRACETLGSPVPDDLAAVDLQGTVRALGEITGETAAPDVIERMFHDFCIGK